jgi:hypothetical protein
MIRGFLPMLAGAVSALAQPGSTNGAYLANGG